MNHCFELKGHIGYNVDVCKCLRTGLLCVSKYDLCASDFDTERKAITKLQNVPNIIRLLSAHTFSDPISHKCERSLFLYPVGKMSLKEKLESFQTVEDSQAYLSAIKPQLIKLVESIHKKRVCHSDLHPGNFIITHDNQDYHNVSVPVSDEKSSETPLNAIVIQTNSALAVDMPEVQTNNNNNNNNNKNNNNKADDDKRIPDDNNFKNAKKRKLSDNDSTSSPKNSHVSEVENKTERILLIDFGMACIFGAQGAEDDDEFATACFEDQMDLYMIYNNMQRIANSHSTTIDFITSSIIKLQSIIESKTTATETNSNILSEPWIPSGESSDTLDLVLLEKINRVFQTIEHLVNNQKHEYIHQAKKKSILIKLLDYLRQLPQMEGLANSAHERESIVRSLLSVFFVLERSD